MRNNLDNLFIGAKTIDNQQKTAVVDTRGIRFYRIDPDQEVKPLEDFGGTVPATYTINAHWSLREFLPPAEYEGYERAKEVLRNFRLRLLNGEASQFEWPDKDSPLTFPELRGE